MLYEPSNISAPFSAQETSGIAKMPQSQIFAGSFPVNTVPTARMLEENINCCVDVINDYQFNHYYGNNYGITKTGKLISELYGAAQTTAMDTWMGGGNMYAGRDYRDQYNQAIGYIMCFRDIVAIMGQQQYYPTLFQTQQVSFQPPYLPMMW